MGGAKDFAPIDDTFDQDEGQQAKAQQRSSGQPERRLELSGYEVKESLGRGAYGEVWRAVQENTGREVAVKVFSRHKGLDWPLLKREVGKLVQVLSERRIVHLLAVGWDADPPYYIMEYVRGGSLAKRLDGKPMPVAEAIPLFRELAEALVYLHGKAILHCDLKPANVLLDDRGQVRLADFGQARLSDEEAAPAGTLFYMAPELTDPKARPDVRSDLYSLGAVLYTMLTGKPPYSAASSTQDLASTGTLTARLERYREIVEKSPPPTNHHGLPGVDKALAAIVDRCLRRNPGERFANVQQILDALTARERDRAQRPLIAFGVLGPLALLAILFGIGSVAWERASGKADTAVRAQALESNLEMARVIAAAVDDRLAGIERRVSREAENPRVARLLAEAGGLGNAAALAKDDLRKGNLHQRFQEHTDALQEQYGGRNFYSWIIAGRDAYLWARSPFDEIVGNSYPQREWFNGKGDFPQAPPDTAPRGESGLTLAFRSTAAGRPPIFTAASPIKSSNGEVVGILGATVHVDTFNKWLKAAEGDLTESGCPSRFVVVLNRHGQLLRHPCPLPGSPEIPVPRESFFDKAEVASLLRTKTDADYNDPLRPGDSYFAAASPLKDHQGWFVVVQQSGSAALRPVHELSAQFDRLRWIALAVGLAVVAALWAVLLRVIRAAPDTAGAKP
jgi:hypothetical protein